MPQFIAIVLRWKPLKRKGKKAFLVAKIGKLGFALLFACLASGAWADGIGDYLPAGDVDARMMRVTLSPRATELANKMLAAAQNNPDAFLKNFKNAKPGEPLPYDESTGLTREEYAEFLTVSRQQGLEEAARVKIHVIHNPDGTISLTIADGFTLLSDLKFDPAKNIIKTPYGTLDKAEPMDQSGEKQGGAMGPYKGINFQYEKGNLEAFDGTLNSMQKFSAVTIDLTVGKTVKTNQRFLFYELKIIENGVKKTAKQLILEY